MRRIAALFLLSLSASALAADIPIHQCSFPRTPTSGPIPCSYTNEDGQTWQGTVVRTADGVVCRTAGRMSAAIEQEALQSAWSMEKELGGAPICTLSREEGEGKELALCEAPEAMQSSKEELERLLGEGTVQAAVRLCHSEGCLELTAYTDCADFLSTEILFEGWTCDDLQ